MTLELDVEPVRQLQCRHMKFLTHLYTAAANVVLHLDVSEEARGHRLSTTRSVSSSSSSSSASLVYHILPLRRQPTRYGSVFRRLFFHIIVFISKVIRYERQHQFVIKSTLDNVAAAWQHLKDCASRRHPRITHGWYLECVGRPRLEPVNSAAVDERRKLAQPVAERVADRTHCQYDVQLVATALYEHIEQSDQRTVRLFRPVFLPV